MCSTNVSKLIEIIDDTNFQDVILEKVPGNADEAAPQFSNSIIDNDTGEDLEYQNLIIKDNYREVWTNYFRKELDQLAQGRAQLASGTDTLFFRKMKTSRKSDTKT